MGELARGHLGEHELPGVGVVAEQLPAAFRHIAPDGTIAVGVDERRPPRRPRFSAAPG